MGDEHSRLALGLPAPQQIEDALGLIGRQRGRDLVQQQHVRGARSSAGRIHQAQRLQRQFAHERVEVEPVEVELGQPLAQLAQINPAEARLRLRFSTWTHKRDERDLR